METPTSLEHEPTLLSTLCQELDQLQIACVPAIQNR